jgi:adenine phosphoribosyltransferase
MTVYFEGGLRTLGFAKTVQMPSPPHLEKEINQSAQAVAARIEDVEDFPIPGVTFKDMGPLWRDPVLSKRAIGAMILMVEEAQGRPDCVVGIESRGFIFGPAMALHWDVPFVPFRKPGKLPGALNRVSYDLEYGSAELECQANAFKPGMRVLIHDDVFATGGTARAAIQLVEACKAVTMACAFIIELNGLNGREGWPLPSVDESCLSLVHFK